jgi:sporulation protein YqfC
MRNVRKNQTKEESVKGSVVLYGNKQAIIEGCKGVVDYCEEFLKLDLGKLVLKISGRDLVIESYVYEELELKGEIVSVEFMN